MAKAKSKRVPFDYKSAPVPSITPELSSFIFDNELRWWITGLKKADVKKELIESDLIGKKVSNNLLNTLLWNYCTAYMHWKRKPKAASKSITPEGWDKLKAAAEFLSDDLVGRTFTEACHIIRSRISTNEAQLAGLPARLRYWEQKTPVSSN